MSVISKTTILNNITHDVRDLIRPKNYYIDKSTIKAQVINSNTYKYDYNCKKINYDQKPSSSNFKKITKTYSYPIDHSNELYCPQGYNIITSNIKQYKINGNFTYKYICSKFSENGSPLLKDNHPTSDPLYKKYYTSDKIYKNLLKTLPCPVEYYILSDSISSEYFNNIRAYGYFYVCSKIYINPTISNMHLIKEFYNMAFVSPKKIINYDNLPSCREGYKIRNVKEVNIGTHTIPIYQYTYECYNPNYNNYKDDPIKFNTYFYYLMIFLIIIIIIFFIITYFKNSNS